MTQAETQTNRTESTENPVLVSRDGHVMVITLNRPQVRNAIDLNTAVALGDALQAADRDPEIRAIIITGAGTQAFCAGADLKAVARGERILPNDPLRRAWGFAGIVSHPISKPIVAAVNGFALGGGTEIVLACDLAVATDTASFGLPEVRRGIIAAAGGAFRLSKQLPPKIAMEMLLTGNPIAAKQALTLGLINTVVAPEALMDCAMSLAQRISTNAPLAVQATKRIAHGIQDGRIDSEEAAWKLTHQERDRVFASADAKEGPAAFAEKRAPVWQSR